MKIVAWAQQQLDEAVKEKATLKEKWAEQKNSVAEKLVAAIVARMEEPCLDKTKTKVIPHSDSKRYPYAGMVTCRFYVPYDEVGATRAADEDFCKEVEAKLAEKFKDESNDILVIEIEMDERNEEEKDHFDCAIVVRVRKAS